MKLITPLFSTLMISILLSSTSLYSQDLMSERIRKIDERKRSVYVDQGIFHNGSGGVSSTVKAIRHGLSENRDYERVVFDFTTKEVPRIYAHLSNSDQKLYLDLFRTNLSESVESFGDSRLVKGINFLPIDTGDVSVELVFKENVNIEIFYLKNPGRLVVDIK